LNDNGRIGDVRGESAMPRVPDGLLHAANRREGPFPDSSTATHKEAPLHRAAGNMAMGCSCEI
jgi:hypothetical protein